MVFDLPRPEYPRPQMVRDEWVSLNGEWEFELDPGRSGEEHGVLDRPFSKRIVVPFPPESPLSGIGERDFMPCVWYRREFCVPESWRAKRILLRFGAVDYNTKVWVNGVPIGTHRGGYTPFAFDITDYLRNDCNTVTLRVIDDTRDSLQASGKQSDRYESYRCLYTRTTGIWQTVWMEAVPEVHIRSLKFYPNVEARTLTLFAEIAGKGTGYWLRVSSEVSGEVRAPAVGTVVLTIGVADSEPWEPGNPALYDIECSIEKDGETIDEVRSYFGLREVRIEGKKILLNGKSIFQRLVLDQGYYPDGIYAAPDDSSLKRDIEISLAMGFNGARLHEKVFEPRFLYWADRLGYIVWGEYPNWGLDHANPQALGRMLTEWLEVLRRDFNHPSIIGWCPFNETPGNQDCALIHNIYSVTKAIDPTRPAIDTSGYTHIETDIYDCHNYEGDPAKFFACFEPFKHSEEVWSNTPRNAEYRGQPFFVSEYGGIWWNPGQEDEKAWGYGERPRSEEEFLKRYRALTETLLFHPKISGFCYTQLYDIEQEVNGLYTYDRRPKFDPKLIREINTQKASIES